MKRKGENTRMKKEKWLSLLLALCMVLSLLPVSGLKTVQAASNKYYTVEKYDAEGNGTMLVPPTMIEYTGSGYSYGKTFLTALLGSGNVNLSDDAITGIKYQDLETGEDVWLENSSEGSWCVAVGDIVYEDPYMFYASDASVFRFVFVAESDITKAGFSTSGGGYGSSGSVPVDKSELIKTLSDYDGSSLGGNRKAAFDAGIATILNPDATADEIAEAKENMENASDSATGVELNKESTELYVGQKETLEATLSPGGSTDTLTWTSSDDAVVTVTDGVLKGMKAGTATVTVTADNPSVTDSIDVTVQGLQGLYICNMGSSNVIAAETQELMLLADVEPGGLENLDWQWSVEDETIAEVTPMEGNEYMASVKGKKEGKTNIIVTLGSMTSTFEVEVTPYDGPYVYFEYADGREPQLLDENNTITLTCLDEGKFVVGRSNGGTTSWSGGSDYVTSLAGGDDLQYWVFVNSETGVWSPWDVRTLNMTVDSGGWYKEFKVNCVSSGISELKTYVGDQEVTLDDPYVTEGTVSGVGVTVKGKNADEEWVTISPKALHYTTSDTTYNFRWVGNQMYIGTGGQATMSVFMKDNWSVKQQFIAKCTYVPLTGFTIETPETFTITGEKDFMTGYYYGLQLYSDNLKITYTPSNATNTELIWESLTPDIAFYTSQHNSGIVPLKCGTAKFKVTSQDNSSLTQEVTVKFLYQKPLESAALSKTEYDLKVGDTEVLTITTTPEDATEKGFSYSYSEDGIVEIKDGKIVAKSAGEVTVTGTPLDTTMGCNNITFTVKVTGAAVEQDDPMPTVNAGIAHGLAYLENQSVSKYGDEWNIFTVLRAGGTVSDENKAAYLESAKAAVQSGLSQPTDYARVILTLGVLGEDPTDFGGVNLIEKLYNWKNLDYQTSNQISWTLLALDSKKYEIPGDAVNSRDTLISWLLCFQDESGGFCLTDSTDVDMTGMILQALAPYNNAAHSDVQEAFTKALTWLQKQMGTTAGFAANSSYNENSCTTAQVLTALSVAGIDAVDPANGFTIGKNNMVTNLWSYKAASGFYWDPTVETKGNAMGTQQTTYALEAYRRLVTGANSLYDLTDVSTKESVDYREELDKLVKQAEALNEDEYTDDSWSAMAQKLQIARTLLQSGSTDNTQLKEALDNLQNAINDLVKKPEVNPDEETAKAFEAKVNALPAADKVTVADKENVNGLINEYNGLTEAVKGLISEECVNKLNACAARIADLEAANAVIAKIQAIDKEITVDSETGILAARQAYDLLTDAQKAFVGEENKKALEDAENALKQIQDAAVQNVINNIKQFENTEDIVLADKNVLKDVRSMFEQLPDSLKEKVTNLDVLEAAEAQMKKLEKEYVETLIDNLKAPDELIVTDDEGNTTENITADDITAIAQAQAACDALKKEYGDDIIDEERLNKLNKDVEIASQYEGYVEAYLAEMIAAILNFPEVDDTNVARAEELIARYDSLYDKNAAYLNSIEGLAAKVETIRSQAATVRTALNDAAAVDALFENLSTETITSDEELAAAEAKLAEADAAYEALSELAKAYVTNMSRRNTAQSVINVYKTNKAAAAQVEALIQAAVNAVDENTTADSSVAALKAASEAYDALTEDVKAMVSNYGALVEQQNIVAEAKNTALAANGFVTINGSIPYDVVVNITEAGDADTDSVEEALMSDKEAELKKAFKLEKYKVYADGSLGACELTLEAVINAGEDLTGKNVYILQNPATVARTVSGMNYLRTVVNGTNVTFTMDEDGIYALGIATVASSDDNTADNDNTTGTDTNTSTPSGTSTSTSNKTASGTSTTAGTTTTGTSTSSSVPKTGDAIPGEVGATTVMILAAAAVLAMLNKKRKTL